jgi:hypothetical protein
MKHVAASSHAVELCADALLLCACFNISSSHEIACVYMSTLATTVPPLQYPVGYYFVALHLAGGLR